MPQFDPTMLMVDQILRTITLDVLHAVTLGGVLFVYAALVVLLYVWLLRR